MEENLVQMVERKLLDFKLEFQSRSIDDDTEHAEAILREIEDTIFELKSKSAITESDDHLIRSTIWFNAVSLKELIDGKLKAAKKKREVQLPMYEKCNARMIQKADVFQCPSCGLSQPIHITRGTNTKAKVANDRRMIDINNWLLALEGKEGLPPKVADAIPAIKALMEADGYDRTNIPDINIMRKYFADASLKDSYKHVVAVRGTITGYFPGDWEIRDREIIKEACRAILDGLTKLQTNGEIKNMPYVPTIIKYIISQRKDWEEKYQDLMESVHAQGNRTVGNIYSRVDTIDADINLMSILNRDKTE